jgi:PBP1b-binding outer membrane lipoprotein LpoB
MKMKSIVAWSLVAMALAGCAGQPAWNTAVFPEQPMYAVPGAAATVAEAPKK